MSNLNHSKRPFGITALGVFFCFGTLACGVSAISLLRPGSFLEPIWRLNQRGHEAFLHMGLWVPLLLVAVCLACATSACGFLAGKRWGYRLGVSLLLINLVGDLLNVILG